MNTTHRRTDPSPEPSAARRPGRRWLLVAAGLMATVMACDDDPAQPTARGQLQLDRTSVTFLETDPVLGSVEMPEVVVTNTGDGTLTVDAITLEGADASAFALDGADATPFTLSPGEDRTLRIGFMPAQAGSFEATVRIASDDSANDAAELDVSGAATVFTYAQVDRKGIPALNTVFNHPAGVAGFDKTVYNVASPADDVATYRATFIVVLDAVGNADAEATADLLLPDELPIDMGVSETAFADLTGRAPADDATDVALSVTVGVPSLQSDNVDANDKAFSGEFPFLASPH